MDQSSEFEGIKAILLKELNQRRVQDGKAPLARYPEVECTSCGEASDGQLIASAASFIRKCQACVLKEFPFTELRLAPGERIAWYRNNPTFHRGADYGIVVTDRAVYLFSPFWRLFGNWRRFALAEIRGAAFYDSRWFPTLRLQTTRGTATLRTPLDYRDEMEHDRRNLTAAAEKICMALPRGRKMTHTL